MSIIFSKKNLRDAGTEWLSKYDLNVFLTVTLKKTIFHSRGATIYIDHCEAEKTAGFIRDRFLVKLSRVASVDKKTIPFFIFYENGSGCWNPHLHICTRVPDNVSIEDYETLFRTTAASLHWVNRQIDVRPITYGNTEDWQGVCHYSLKTGFDAFLPTASNIP